MGVNSVTTAKNRRTPLIAGNWKMNLDHLQAVATVQKLHWTLKDAGHEGDSVEVAVGFMKEVGAFLSEASPKATHATFERFRSILHEAAIDKRVQYMIEVLFQIRKDRFKVCFDFSLSFCFFI